MNRTLTSTLQLAILFCLIFACLQTSAQDSNNNSSNGIQQLEMLAVSMPGTALDTAGIILTRLAMTDGQLQDKGLVLYWKGVANFNLKNYAQALSDLKMSLQQLETLPPVADILRACVWFKMGDTFTKLHEFDSAQSCFYKSIDLKVQIYGECSKEVALAYNILGGYYAGLGDANESIRVRYKGLELAGKAPGAEEVLVKLYNNLGRLHFGMGDYDRAIPLLNNGLVLNAKTVRNPMFHAFLNMNLLDIYSYQKEFEKARHYGQQADSIYRANPDLKSRHYYWEAMSRFYFQQGLLDSALIFADQELAGLSKDDPGYDRFVAGNSYSKAGLFLAKQDFDSTLIYAEKGVELEKKLLGPISKTVATGYRLRGLAAMGKEDYDDAIHEFTQALTANNFNKNPATAFNYEEAIFTLAALGKAYFEKFKLTGNDQFLKASLEWHDLADQTVTYRRRELYASSSKERITEEVGPAYESAVKICLQLQKETGDKAYFDKAFYFSERRKSVVLSETIQATQASVDAKVPMDCMEMQLELLRKIASYRHLRSNVYYENSPEDRAKIAEADRQIQLLTVRFDSLLASAEQSCTNLSDLKKQEITVAPDVLKSWCDSSESAVLEYFLTDGSLVIFAINETGLTVKEIPLPNNFDELVQQFRLSISEVPLYEDDPVEAQRRQLFWESSHALYKLLVAPIRGSLRERLMVIPDGELAYIPFAALIENEPTASQQLNMASYPYLVRYYAFGYSFSAALLLQMEGKKHPWQPSPEFCAIAPDFENEAWSQYQMNEKGSDNFQLHFNMVEADTIHQILGGRLLTGNTAVRTRLLENIYARILHFSTHAFAYEINSDRSYLALTDSNNPQRIDPLYLWEIPYLPLAADMVFLSACETGIGRLTKTEGIVSLARSFAYAGAKNVFATLWSVKDHQEGAGLIFDFYENMLTQHLPKDQAMQSAQVKYLESHLSSALAHPHYWAAFIGIGDRSALFPAR